MPATGPAFAYNISNPVTARRSPTLHATRVSFDLPQVGLYISYVIPSFLRITIVSANPLFRQFWGCCG